MAPKSNTGVLLFLSQLYLKQHKSRDALVFEYRQIATGNDCFNYRLFRSS